MVDNHYPEDLYQTSLQFYARDPEAGWPAAQQAALRYARKAKEEPPVGVPMAPYSPTEPSMSAGAESLRRHLDRLAAAKPKHASPLDEEREQLEAVLSYLREHPRKTWEQACRELGVSWKVGPSTLTADGQVIQADPYGFRPGDTKAFWGDEARKDHARANRVEYYVAMGVPQREAMDLAAEEASERGERFDYGRGASDADADFCRRFQCTGISKRRCADGTTIWEPVYG
jgi:hypothetical protein